MDKIWKFLLLYLTENMLKFKNKNIIVLNLKKICVEMYKKNTYLLCAFMIDI